MNTLKFQNLILKCFLILSPWLILHTNSRKNFEIYFAFVFVICISVTYLCFVFASLPYGGIPLKSVVGVIGRPCCDVADWLNRPLPAPSVTSWRGWNLRKQSIMSTILPTTCSTWLALPTGLLFEFHQVQCIAMDQVHGSLKRGQPSIEVTHLQKATKTFWENHCTLSEKCLQYFLTPSPPHTEIYDAKKLKSESSWS